jgi:hypothetical protein
MRLCGFITPFDSKWSTETKIQVIITLGKTAETPPSASLGYVVAGRRSNGNHAANSIARRPDWRAMNARHCSKQRAVLFAADGVVRDVVAAVDLGFGQRECAYPDLVP